MSLMIFDDCFIHFVFFVVFDFVIYVIYMTIRETTILIPLTAGNYPTSTKRMRQ